MTFLHLYIIEYDFACVHSNKARFLDLLASRDIAENPHQWCAVLRYPGGILKVGVLRTMVFSRHCLHTHVTLQALVGLHCCLFSSLSKVLNEAGFRAFMTPWIEQGSCDAVRSGGLEALQVSLDKAAWIM